MKSIFSRSDIHRSSNSSALPEPFAEPEQPELSGFLAGLSLPRQIAILSLWPLLEQVLNFLVTFVDTIQAGHLNADSVAAVGFAGYIIWVVGMIQSSVGIGASAIVARGVGAHHRSLVNATLGHSLVMAFIAGVVMAAVIFFLASPISQFVELTGFSLKYSTLFLRTLAFATPMSFVLFVGCASLRGAGDTRTPFQIMLVVNVVNIAANYALVLGPAPLGGHGVAGIAAATDLAWTLGALLTIVSLLRGRHGIRLYLHRLVLRWHLVQRILRVGVPNLFEASATWVAQFLVLKIIGHIGTLGLANAVGIHSVAGRVQRISYLPGFAMSVASATLTGQYLGLGVPEQAKRAVRLCWFAAMAVMGVIGLAFLLIPRPLIAIVTNDPDILRQAPTLLRISGPSEIFLGTYLVLSQAMRGAGDTRTPMFLSYFSMFCVRLPATYIFGLMLGGNLIGVWLALCGELVFRGVIFACFFWRGRWTKAKV